VLDKWHRLVRCVWSQDSCHVDCEVRRPLAALYIVLIGWAWLSTALVYVVGSVECRLYLWMSTRIFKSFVLTSCAYLFVFPFFFLYVMIVCRYELALSDGTQLYRKAMYG